MMSYDRKASGGTEPAERARRLGTMHMLAEQKLLSILYHLP